MIISISFDPCEMDYPSWLTVSGFIMAVLLFFMNVFLHNSKNKDDNYYSTILGLGITILITIITVGILCFIYNLEYLGAILVTIVLSILPLFFLIVYWFRRLRQNNLQENTIDLLLLAYQPSIDFD